MGRTYTYDMLNGGICCDRFYVRHVRFSVCVGRDWTNKGEAMKCSVCKAAYDDHQSKCPKCGSDNPLLRPSTFMKISIEMETALFRGIQRECRGGETPEEFIVRALEEYITQLQKPRVRSE